MEGGGEMSGAAEAFLQRSRIADKVCANVVKAANPSTVSAVASGYDERVRMLVELLFLHREPAPRRHIGFISADIHTDSARLCLSVARILSEQGRYDVGLIDASSRTSPLNFQIAHPEVRGSNTSEIERRLWTVQRQEWTNGDSGSISDEDLVRLSDLTRQFDFSILCCGAMSSLASKVGRVCDGLVLVLNATQTRRLVAQNIRDQLGAAQVPLLGTVLAGRRFPIPTALYRKL